MSQHDFEIANQGFPSFRSDLNSGLQALASNSAGATEPSATYAYQMWYDSTANLLKMRNTDNDAWITLAFFDQTNDEWEIRSAVIQAVDGAGVSIKTDDGTTRISVSDAGVVSFENYAFPSADGTSGQVLATDGSGTLSFTSVASDKIEEGNSSVEVVDTGTGYVAVTVDGSETARFDANGRLGIGTTSPGTAFGKTLHITGQSAAVITEGTTSGGRIYYAGTNAVNEWAIYDGTAAAYRFRINTSGNVTIAGSLSKGSGSFKIDHPIKPESHHLVHSFIEGPQADNIYRGKVDLVNGTAAVNIDTVSEMTEGTFVALNREVQCFTSNESGWTAVRGSVSGNTLTIEAQDNTCTDTISWMVIGERKDQHMYDTEWTDENGKVIVEPEKVIQDGALE